MKKIALVMLMSIALPLGAGSAPAAGELVPGAQAASGVTVRNVVLSGGGVTGVVANESPYVVKNVQVLVRYIWHWNDERNPGDDSPGRSDYATVLGEIPPGSALNFKNVPNPPLPLYRADGHFTAEAHVVGFTQVGE
jgi:hypothetical protein